MSDRGYNVRAGTEQLIIAEYSDGFSAEIVSIRHGLSKKTVLNILKRNNVQRRDVHEARRQSKGDFLRPRPAIERFWERVQKTIGCWVWTGAKYSSGYGRFFLVRGRNHVTVCAHRYSWFITYGDDPGELHVCHECDNPPCVRPDHLFLGTDQDNSDDMVNKSRQAKGTMKPNAKLTDEKAAEIRRIREKTGMEYEDIGELFGVHKVTVSDVVQRKTWKHVWP